MYMQNPELWVPTKIVPFNGGWQSNNEFVGRRSEHVASLECAAYSELLEDHISGDLLDIGAGTVPYYGIYKDLTDSVTCTDWSNSLHDTSHIDVCADASYGLPFKEQAFDTVVLADVLEHVSNPQSLVAECSRVLKTSGKLVVFVPFMYWIHEQPNDHFRYTEYALRNLVEYNAMEVVKLEEYGGGPDVIVDITQKMFCEMPKTYNLNKLFWTFCKKTSIYEKLRATHSRRMPIGYSLVAQKS